MQRRAHRTRKRASRPPRGPRPRPRYWSRRVTETSDALDLEPAVFTQRDARAIARSLKRSAERSDRRRADPFRSAMSMLTFYINRAGTHLSAERKRTLNRAKDELRAAFHRPPAARARARRGRTRRARPR